MKRFVLRSWFACCLFIHAYAFLSINPVAAQDGTINQVLMADFVTTPGAPKKVIVRGAGPTANSATPNVELVHFWFGVVGSSANWTPADNSLLATLPTFVHPATAREAALVTTINPSSGYTAILSHLNTSQDLAVVEVYDVTGAPVLVHSSTRGDIENAGAAFTASFSLSASSGPRRLLIRGIGPGLATLGVPGVLNDPILTVLNATQQSVASNDNWSSSDAAVMTQVGAFALPNGSRDAAVITDFQPGTYTVRVSDKNGGTGSLLIEVYDLGPGQATTPGTIGVRAQVASTASTHSSPAELVFSRTGNLEQALTVNYTLSGTARANTDYSGPTGSVTIPAGSANVSVFVTALPQGGTDGSKTLTVTLAPQSGYEVTSGSAQVQLFYGPGTLFVANLRPPASVPNSAAFGTSSVQLSADERFLVINLTFSGLSSQETVSYLRMSVGTEDGAYLVRLPAGGVSSREWQIQPSGSLSVADIVAGLKTGKVYVSVGSENFPAGELRGNFLAAQDPNNPPPDPGNPPATVTPEAAARFLQQATFGPRKSEIDNLVSVGYNAWIAEQMALPPSLHKDAAQADFTAFNTNPTATRPGGGNRQAAWWKIALTGPDQLRQRVAFALSEIFVISDVNGTIANWQDGAANYYDLLARNAFGNFRTLLEEVTLSPMMGIYLSHIRNGKATATTQPDENYAREVMQLFTIGLNQLQPDGSLKLDTNGRPIPTYDQRTITEMAKVFTGWQFNNPAPTRNNFRAGGGVSDDYMKPMTLNPNFHEDSAKTIVGNITLPANQGGAKDLADTLNALFQHPNTAPFISRQLIQRLVTSNPSSGYIARVAQVFANNGSGVRGDLGAVIKAILLDPEARSATTAQSPSFGKLKEPLLRVTALLRAFNASAENGRFAIGNPENALAQAALRSPTVFNFFEPAYVMPGALAAAGLYAPEYQILTDTTAISVPNNLYSYIVNTRGPTVIGLDLTGLPPTTPANGLVDYMNLVFCAGSMPQAKRDRITTALTALPRTATDLDRYRAAIYLTVSTQAAAIQK